MAPPRHGPPLGAPLVLGQGFGFFPSLPNLNCHSVLIFVREVEHFLKKSQKGLSKKPIFWWSLTSCQSKPESDKPTKKFASTCKEVPQIDSVSLSPVWAHRRRLHRDLAGAWGWLPLSVLNSNPSAPVPDCQEEGRITTHPQLK
jgi:hypothetical protein